MRKFNPEKLNKYFRGELKHPFYEKTVELAKSVCVHANGEYPEGLIDERRPSESDFIKNYRKKIWKPITLETFSSVQNELMKIRKADDWSVKYDVTKFYSGIKEGESPYNYFEESFPVFGSVTNWTFDVLLNTFLRDANAVCLVLPMEVTAGAAFRRPFPLLFGSAQVYEYIEGEVVILKAMDSGEYTEGSEVKKGDVFYVVDKTDYVQYTQVDGKGNFDKTEEIKHNLGYLPAFRLRGEFFKHHEGDFIWRSLVYPMVPRLDEAVREYSDLQAEVVQHIHSEKWVIDTQKCNVCSGSGKTRQGNPVEIVTCPQCKGSGTVSTSPYSNMVLKVPKMGEQPLPIPPAGYIQKDVEIVKIQDERVDKHVYKALASLNMQYLHKTPLNESGLAKEVDKDSLNNFVNRVGECLVWIMDRVYQIATDWRYKELVPAEKARKAMLPKNTVPAKLDLLSPQYLVEEVGKLKTAKVSPIIVNATEVELANKKFAADPSVRDMVVCIYDLDPMSGLSADEKMSMLQNKGISREDYVISCNIQRLVKLALVKNPDFFSLEYEKKLEILATLAAPIIASTELEIDTEKQMEEDAAPAGGGAPNEGG